MPKVSDMLFKPEPQFPPTGCKQCDDLAKLTNGKIRACLIHDETIDPEWRKQIRVAFETLVVGDHQFKQGESNAKSE